MTIAEKLKMNADGIRINGAINIVAFGDSVTHGILGYNEVGYETTYWNRLRNKILSIRNYVPVNVIDSGIEGITAKDSLDRMDRDVFSHNPDLVIVCFGLNDVNFPIEEYTESLATIFKKCNEKGIFTIFLTPNMLNTYVAEDTFEGYKSYAEKTAEMQNGGRMDTYIEAARKTAQDNGIPVCDCYSKWKEISKTEDTTMLLANRVNHPTREMHELFADSLFRMIFADEPEILEKYNSK
ncbi:MAG: hypothetical protein IJZ75_07835 [Clostridia bacterium]|nr:hypothetical protein [Clostridia bacterium]